MEVCACSTGGRGYLIPERLPTEKPENLELQAIDDLTVWGTGVDEDGNPIVRLHTGPPVGSTPKCLQPFTHASAHYRPPTSCVGLIWHSLRC